MRAASCWFKWRTERPKRSIFETATQSNFRFKHSGEFPAGECFHSASSIT
jgi:hypothetical protein